MSSLVLARRQGDLVEAVDVHQPVELAAQREDIVERHQLLRLFEAGERQPHDVDRHALKVLALLEPADKRVGPAEAELLGDRAADDAQQKVARSPLPQRGPQVGKTHFVDRLQVIADFGLAVSLWIEDPAHVGMDDLGPIERHGLRGPAAPGRRAGRRRRLAGRRRAAPPTRSAPKAAAESARAPADTARAFCPLAPVAAAERGGPGGGGRGWRVTHANNSWPAKLRASERIRRGSDVRS